MSCDGDPPVLRCDEHAETVRMLRAAVAAADERCRQVERNNQVLRDEYLALQTTNNALEEKFKKVRTLLIHRSFQRTHRSPRRISRWSND